MAFADFLDLRTAVIEQVGRSDIADVMPRLTLLAEGEINRKMRLRQQITNTTLTLIEGVAALPADFSEVIGVFSPSGVEYIQQGQVGGRNNAGSFSVDGSSLTIKAITGDVDLSYYAKVPTITGSMTASNWLLQAFPEVYLYAVAYQAAKATSARDMAADMAGLMGEAISQARIDDSRARYARVRVRVQGVTP